jgi:protein-S-isoprenylcysteine O-methyltransferase Ste14
LVTLLWLQWHWIGQPQPLAFWIAVAFPICHQIFVWIAWRLELRSSAVSRTLGFGPYLAIFFVLFAGRFVSLVALGWMDFGTLLAPSPSLQITLTCLLALPGIYALYSVARYFGLKRAAGADHFFDSYRSKPLVKEGIFRFTDNGMYVFAFLLFWAIAIGFDSPAALAVVAFSHLYIWVHFFTVEKPDMKFLYAPGSASQNQSEGCDVHI